MKIQEDIIVIREIEDLPARLYSPQNKLIGVIKNQLQLYDIRIQIASQKLEGYYIMFQGIKIIINRLGRCENTPPGFFDIWDNQLSLLIKTNANERSKTTR